MPKRSSKQNARDINVLASKIVEEATGEPTPKPGDSTKNPAAGALGRLGGLKGGKARATKLTPEQRKEIAKKAARVRWAINNSLSPIRVMPSVFNNHITLFFLDLIPYTGIISGDIILQDCLETPF